MNRELEDFENETKAILRPANFETYIGQKRIVDNMKIFVQASRKRKEALDHVLLHGSPGLGKTSLANVIANELGANIKSVIGPSIETPIDIINILIQLEKKDVLFIDEIHRLKKNIEEILYTAIEDFRIDIMSSENEKVISLDLPQFTLIGATTEIDNMSPPLIDRFQIKGKLEHYSVSELQKIVMNNSEKLNVGITKNACISIAKKSRGVPRVANSYLKRMRDFADIKNNGMIDENLTEFGFKQLGIDNQGLNDVDIMYLKSIYYDYKNCPVGLETISAKIKEGQNTVKKNIEPYLISIGYLLKTPRGRVLSEKGIEYIETNYKKEKQ